VRGSFTLRGDPHLWHNPPRNRNRTDGREPMTAESTAPVRCLCNRLLCIRSGNNIEIKCNKCKRILRIETTGIIRMSYHEEQVDVPTGSPSTAIS
jgi:phage FluMu protein Com